MRPLKSPRRRKRRSKFQQETLARMPQTPEIALIQHQQAKINQLQPPSPTQTTWRQATTKVERRSLICRALKKQGLRRLHSGHQVTIQAQLLMKVLMKLARLLKKWCRIRTGSRRETRCLTYRTTVRIRRVCIKTMLASMVQLPPVLSLSTAKTLL